MVIVDLTRCRYDCLMAQEPKATQGEGLRGQLFFAPLQGLIVDLRRHGSPLVLFLGFHSSLLEPVMHFVRDKAVRSGSLRASSSGWQMNERVIPAM